MSERKPRYFQHEFGGVYYATLPDAVADYESDRTMTEVQVVPVDAIVIRRDELPTARVLLSGHLGTIHGHHSAKLSANWHRDLAAHHLALADYVDAHPPVDEAQVKALAELVDELQEHGKAYYEDPREFAEDLVKRGVRVGDA